ncbi:MAG: peptidase domain-containing ABC transporter [Paludibacter sp.]|nr:peptidase domain-containing ABC transporter [Paludibacter sp.]
MRYKLKQIRKDHILQRYQSDCGVACLLSIIQYYGGSESIERLRELSGTTMQGTTLFGLYQTAEKMGFEASGVRGEIRELKNNEVPVVLHFLYEDGLEHYVVCYGYNAEDGFLIGDPATEVKYLTEKELDLYWKKRFCLILSPNKNFRTTKATSKKKRKLFIQLLKVDYKLLFFTVLIGMCIALLGMAMSIFSQKLIDNILPAHNIHKLISGIILLALLLILRVGFMVLREFIILKQSRDFNNRVNTNFFKNILQLPKIFFDNRKIGELVARLNDTHRIQDVIKSIVSSTVLDSMICLISIIILWVYSWQIALICLTSLPIYFYLIYRNRKKIIFSQKSIMQAYALNESNYIATIQGIATVKNDSKQGFFEKNSINVYHNFQDKIFDLGLINIRMSWQAGFAGVIFLICILCYTTIAVLNKELKLGELMAILGISGSLLPSIGNLALVFIPINEAKVAFDRMYDFISVEKEFEEGEDIDELNSIELKDISFCFAGRKPLFENVNITLSKGTITAIIGESGSGKTTLANILQKFYPWEKGKIVVNNEHELQHISIESWRSRMGVIPQEVHIFNGNVLYNIVLDDNCNNELLQEIINQYDLSGFILNLPNGLMTLVGEEGVNLSGGQKQIIGLLRVLYRQPQFYILDEPTAALDKNTEKLVICILEKIKKNSIILLITHRLSLIDHIADTTYEMNKILIKKR